MNQAADDTTRTGGAALDHVLITPELDRRPSRAPDYAFQAQVMDELVASLADDPANTLQRLADVAVRLCRSGSAGISLAEGSNGSRSFRWVAVAGEWADKRGGVTPIDASPCSMVVERDAALLFAHPERQFPAARHDPPITEVLLVPFRMGGAPIGAIWAVAHDPEHKFDREDERVLLSLSHFASIVLQTTRSLAEVSAVKASALESRERLQLAMEAAGQGSWEIDLASMALQASPNCRAALGRADDAPFDFRELEASVHPDDRGRLATIFQRSVATGEPFDTEYRIMRPEGITVWVHVRGKLIYADNGAPLRIAGVVSDVTARKAAELDLIALNETLERRVQERSAELVLTEDALRQSQKMEAIGQLTGGVAHDFNNLLTVIRSSVDLLRRPGLAEDRRVRYLDAIADTSDRAAKLTGQLLAFARRQALKAETLDVVACVSGIADMLRTVLGARIELAIEAVCQACYVEADRAQFETAIVNMAVNARDAMAGEGRLTIRVEPEVDMPALRGHAGAQGAFVAVALSDTGSGVPEDVLPRLFEPFFTTKEVGKGTGLGLSQVYGFAKQSGGDVDVSSRPGEGAIFTLYLPRVGAPAVQNSISEPEQRAQPHGRVLLVEDNLEVGEFATHLLEDLGYQTRLATSAAEAIDLLERNWDAFDLVFTDVVMPGMSGVELGRHIRDRRPDFPVVLASGYSHVLAEDARHGFPLVHKPYSADTLARALLRAQAEVGR